MTYAFQNEPIDVGLALSGAVNLVGPIVFTALFIPAERVLDVLLRYDLFRSTRQGNSDKEKIADVARYNRLLSLNRTELGYLVKKIEP
jgi:hypothetical protein